jgi:exopolysaccharide biosynthesis polyprenyl glycosylphosphotransferase
MREHPSVSDQHEAAPMAVLDAPGSSFIDLPDKALTSTRRDLARAWAVGAAWLTDNVLVIGAVCSGTFLRFGNLLEGNAPRLLIVVLPTFLLAALALRCYDPRLLRHPFRSARQIVLAGVLTLGMLFAAAFAFQVGALFSRLESGIIIITAGVFLGLGRALLAVILSQKASTIDPVVVILGGLKDRSRTGGANFIVPRVAPDPSDPAALEQIYLQVQNADRVLLAFADPKERRDWIEFVRLIGINAEVIEPELQQIVPIGLGSWDGVATLVVARSPLKIQERMIKKVLDLALSIFLLVLLSPILVILIVLIKLDSSGPAIFIQPRVGRNNRRYDCYKFRTMFHDSGDLDGEVSTKRDDRRVTKLGTFLRRTSLDELPQLWNVIKGEMSLVGPRPHALGSTAQGAAFWEVEPGYWTRHAIKPGITGLAQIRGLRGGNVSRCELQDRVAADLEYINNWSIWLDLKIIIKTVSVMIHRNAY